MLRKSLLATLLLMALMTPWAAQAQETLTVYDGTNTNTYVPFYGLYADDGVKCEFVIPADSLEDMTGGTISAMKFYLKSVGTNTITPTFTVFVKEVDFTTFTALTGTTGATTVFNNSITFTSNTSEVEVDFPFSSDYSYGGGNLLIGIYQDAALGSGNYSATAWYGVTQSSNTAWSGSGNGTGRQFLPKTTFTYEPAATDCPNPKTLVASDVTTHGATMTWTMDDETSEYNFNLEYKKTTEGETEWHRIELDNVRTYPLTGLDAETEYQVRIQTVCDPENDKWKNASNFTTLVACPAPTNLAVTDGSITSTEAIVTWEGTSNSYVVMVGQENLILNANFEDNAIPATFTNSTTYPWTVTAGGANGSSYCAIPGNKGVNSSTSDLTYAVTGPCTVSFMAKVSSESGYDYGRFLIDNTQKMQISGTQDWTSYSYEVTEGTHNLVWRYYKDSSSASGSDLFYIDNIVISAGVASWTEYETANDTYIFEGLTPNTSYQVKVKGNCGSEGYSAETEPVSFTTEVSCIAPTGLAMVEGYPTAHAASFIWDYESGEVYQYALVQDNVTDPSTIEFNATWNAGDDFPAWDTLNADSDWSFFLRKSCADSDYSEAVYEHFHTLIACPAPTGFVAMPNSITAHTADLTWEGTCESYQVAYRTAAYMDGIDEQFNSTPSGWTRYSGAWNEEDGTGPTSPTSSGWSFGTSNFSNSHAYMNMYSTWKYWLVTPSINVGSNFKLNFDAAYTAYNSTSAPNQTGTDDRFIVLISTDEKVHWTALYEWNNAGTGDAVLNDLPVTFQPVDEIDLSTYEGQTIYIAFYGASTESNTDNHLRIDNVVIGLPVAAGEWQYKTEVTEVPCQLTGLLAETEYEATLLGDCGNEGFSTEVGPIYFTTDIACPAPTALNHANVMSTQADLSWTNGGAEDWVVAYKKTADENFTEVNLGTDDVTIEGTTVTYTLTGLDEETAYTVKVRDNCEASVAGDGMSAWTATTTFTTMAACAVDNVTVSIVGHYTATVNWDGESQTGYTVKYRESAGEDALFSEDFESATSFANWTFTSMNTANNIASGKAGRLAEGAHNGSYGFRFSSYTSADDYNQYLISPELTVTGELKFYAKQYGTGDDIYVGYSTTTSDLDAFTWDETALALSTSWKEFTHELPTNVKYIAFHYYGNYKYYAYVDDITIGAFEVPAGDWQTVTADENTADLTGLTAGIKYDLTVVPNCDETLASEIQQFTTVSENEKYFMTEGDWATATNWEPTGAPTYNQTVELRANVTITGSAEANTISQGTYTITIEDGGKLKTNTGVNATVKKTIRGYGQGVNDEGNPSGYYLIASPITTNYYPKTDGTDGILVGNYDFYSWNYTVDNEWLNYKANQFSMFNSAGNISYGYLYSNEEGTEIAFTGNVKAANASLYRSCTLSTGSYDFPGLYLLGNAYVCDAYLVAGSASGNALPCYKMNETGDGYTTVAAGEAIAPLEGFFFQASNEEGGFSGNVYVTTTRPASNSGSKLNMTVSQGRGVKDNAIIVFGESQKLGKVSFRENSTKIYMPVEGKDYAITNADEQGEMPVNFKAEKNGTYTLSFTAEDVDFSYLHLIDNKTGNDVDLIATPSYTFEALHTDYASRFKLVYAKGNNTSDNFGFINNGNLMILGIEGEATLQVIDVTGRILSSETFSGSYNKAIDAATGVYILRLIQGENARTQKIVVK